MQPDIYLYSEASNYVIPCQICKFAALQKDSLIHEVVSFLWRENEY